MYNLDVHCTLGKSYHKRLMSLFFFFLFSFDCPTIEKDLWFFLLIFLLLIVNLYKESIR